MLVDIAVVSCVLVIAMVSVVVGVLVIDAVGLHFLFMLLLTLLDCSCGPCMPFENVVVYDFEGLGFRV